MVLLGVLASIFLSGSAAGSVPVYRTVVSLTFDDGRISQWTTRDLLKNHGMNATFYLNSGTVDTSGFLSWAQVNSLAADGNEIGGHTIDHPHLTLIPSGDARAEICDDRTALIAHGFAMSSFAYPFGESNPAVEALAAECGYTSARITTGILGSAPWCNTPTEHCPTAETIPPWNPYNIRATGSVTNTTTLAELESFVTSAEQNGGGWLPFVFHDIGGGAEYSISETDFTAFLDWLSLRRSKGTIVRTVGEVMNGSVNPPPPGPNLLQNPSFEIDTNTDGVPDCWTPSQWGANDGSWTEITSDHTPGTAIKGVITSWTSGERRFMVDRSSQCAPPVTPGHSYHVTGWYKGTLPPYLAVFWDDGSGSFSLGSADSPDFPVSSGWHEISWTTPPAPAGATALSIALTIAGATGDITIDDFSLGDAAGTPPHVQISAPTAGNYVSGTTAFTASASDDHGVQSLEFFVDDKPVGEDTGTPYSLGWDSTTTSGGAHTLTVLATDLDGAQSYDSLGFFVDNTDPTGSLTAPAPGSFLRGSVALSSDSADAGSGVASVS
ncbi:MAG: polysaccharide deacetylase family protein, partial [Gaiellaceae bacterium]